MAPWLHCRVRPRRDKVSRPLPIVRIVDCRLQLFAPVTAAWCVEGGGWCVEGGAWGDGEGGVERTFVVFILCEGGWKVLSLKYEKKIALDLLLDPGAASVPGCPMCRHGCACVYTCMRARMCGVCGVCVCEREKVGSGRRRTEAHAETSLGCHNSERVCRWRQVRVAEE